MMQPSGSAKQGQSLLLGWLLVSVLCLVPVLLHQSDDAVILGRYSRSYMIVVGAMVGLTLVAAVVYGLMRRSRLGLPSIPVPQSHAAGWLIFLGGTALAAALWAWLPVSSAGGGIIFRLYVVGMVLAGMLLLLRQTAFAGLTVGPRWLGLMLLAAAVLAVVLNSLYVGAMPASRFYEEPITADTAVSIFDPRTSVTHMFPARDPATHNIYHMSLSMFGLGWWLQQFDFSLEQGRLFFRLLACLGLPFIYLTARRLYGQGAAVGAVGIAIFIPLSHGYLRPSTVVAFTNAMGLYFFFAAREARTPTGSHVRHFLAGLTVALGMEGHPYGFVFAAGMGMIYAVEYLLRIRRSRQWWWGGFWAFALGTIAAALFFIAFRIIMSKGAITPNNFVETVLSAYAHENAIGNNESLLQRLGKTIPYYFGSYISLFPVEFTVLVLGTIAAAYRAVRQRSAGDGYLVALLLASLVGLLLLMAHRNPYYWIFLMPYVGILGGGLVAAAGKMAIRANAVQAALAAALMVLLLTFSVRAVPQQNADELIAMGYTLAEVLPPEVHTVTGWQAYVYGLYPRVMISNENFYMAPMSEWRGVDPPQAMILTATLDDMYPAQHAYLEDMQMQVAWCFPLENPIYNRASSVRVYLPPEFMPDQPQDCAEPSD